MTDKEWLERLRIGDLVYVSERLGAGKIARVKRLTATQIIIERNITGTSFEEKYRRYDGSSIGGDTWSRGHISELTNEKKERVEIANLHLKAANLIDKLAIPETLPELIEFYKELLVLMSKYGVKKP